MEKTSQPSGVASLRRRVLFAERLVQLAEHHPDEPLPQLSEQLHSRPDRCLNLLNS